MMSFVDLKANAFLPIRQENFADLFHANFIGV